MNMSETVQLTVGSTSDVESQDLSAPIFILVCRMYCYTYLVFNQNMIKQNPDPLPIKLYQIKSYETKPNQITSSHFFSPLLFFVFRPFLQAFQPSSLGPYPIFPPLLLLSSLPFSCHFSSPSPPVLLFLPFPCPSLSRFFTHSLYSFWPN